MTGRIAVGVSGAGSNLRALRRAEKRGLLGGTIGLVFADRPCPGLEFAAAEGIATALAAPSDYPDRASWDAALAQTLIGASVDWVVLAGLMRVLGDRTLGAFPERILNIHPTLLPSYPGAHPVRDTLAGGARITGVTIHIVDSSLDGGPIVAQQPLPLPQGEALTDLLPRIRALEHQLLPRVVALALAGGISIDDGRVLIDEAIAGELPRPRRVLLSVSDKSGLVELGRSLADLGFDLVSTGGTARALRDAGVDVIDVASVTGFPEMLDGRVKTLHPRVAAGVLADVRSAEHRRQLAAAAIDPFELVVVNLYRFAEAAARPNIDDDGLIEEIDIGGPTLVRASAKNHANVGIVTDPAQYEDVVAELRDRGRLSDELRRELAAAAFRLTATYDGLIADTLSRRWGTGTEQPGRMSLDLERAEELRYGENPHQSAALYLARGVDLAPGAFANGPLLQQGKPLSYNNILDTAAATGLARDLRGAACVIVKHANPCGVAEADDLAAAWEGALAGDPVSAFGGVVALTGAVDAALAEQLTSIFLEVVAAPEVTREAREILARKPNLRLLLDPGLGAPPLPGMELRSAGGALLMTQADVAPDDPQSWTAATRRAPTDEERAALDLAWRVCRHVKSNAIVLVKGRAVVGVGAGQMSRVDSARLAVAKAGPERAAGAVCASDAFYPFPDALEVCAGAGVTAFVQPGGSQRDAEVIAAADAAGAAMLMTGTRHFRH
ncbi:MAG TPA: bifunctional phosphoribosylaminoimidazolecarboxamide formyltransferase/IMP cyclohydrolase [Candidatus Limnocylindrales bacterium]